MLKYFAYGSNMSAKRLHGRIGHCIKLGACRLDAFDLRFHKVSKKDNSGKCDAYYTGQGSDRVWGVLYEVNSSQKVRLDRIEGLGYGYEERSLKVHLGSEMVDAVTYVATNIDASLLPFSWYLRHVIEGAREGSLPDQYQEKLSGYLSIEDPDSEREKLELSIYG